MWRGIRRLNSSEHFVAHRAGTRRGASTSVFDTLRSGARPLSGLVEGV
jgi:hypothetical protein